MENNHDRQEKVMEEQPPFLSSWNVLYCLVAANLVFLIVIFYFFTKAFS